MTSATPTQPGPSLALDVLHLVPNCTTCQQGGQVAAALRPALQAGQDVVLGVRGVSSSFVNRAFVSLLDAIPVAAIRQHLRVVCSLRAINAMIRDKVTVAAAQQPDTAGA